MRLLWQDSRTSVQYVEERKVADTISFTVQTISRLHNQSINQSIIYLYQTNGPYQKKYR